MRFWPFKKPVVPEDGRIALGNFSLTAQLPNQRTIQVAGYIYSDDDRDALNQRLDLYQESIERQRERCEIPELEAARDQKIIVLGQMRDVLADLEGKQSAGDRLSSQDQMTIKNLRVNLGKAKEDIKEGTRKIAERKLKTGVR